MGSRCARSILFLSVIWACSSDSSGTEVTPPDTIAPTVTVTEPGPVTLTGVVTLSADAEDDRGVSGVRFRVDEADAVPEGTTAPYEARWNSRSVPDGVHFIDAVARYEAGNTVA